MPEDDWTADTEGNLTPPGELVPDTDEFGRDDPAALERERRRREREQRRKGSGRKREKAPKARKAKKPKRARRSRGAASPEAAVPPGDATAEQIAEAAGPSISERAAAGRGALRQRMPRRERSADRSGGGEPPSPRPPRPASYGRRRIAAVVLGLAGILLLWFLVALFQPFAGDGQGEGSVSVEIPEGADAGEIAKVLDENGVISSARLFEIRLRIAGKGDDVQADTYSLAEGMSYGAAIDRLTGEETGGKITVTIPEGLSRDQIASDVLPEGVSSDEYLELTKTAPKGFDPTQYGAKSANLEGFLFPATYELLPDQGADVLVQQQLAAFEQNIANVDLAAAKKKNLTAYDVLIIASMVDKEVQVPKERPLVAAVIYNRLAAGQPLGIDATTRYEYQNYEDQITQEQLAADTPYNTRLNAGLPPTPIGNPGLDAIKAAANPAKVPFLYFVVKPGTCGEHSFTASEKEFETLAAEYQAALEAEGGSPTSCPE